MKKLLIGLFIIIISLSLVSCAADPSRYNTQRGAVIGGGIGAILGGIIGNDWAGVAIGAGIGTIIGSITGNAVDQQNQAAVEAARTNKQVIYYDNNGRAVESFPEASQQTNCKKVTTRVWDHGTLVSERTEEICRGSKDSQTY